jgi:hypothetical protein
MRKEFIYAIIIGGILGLIVAFGVWRVKGALSPNKDAGNPSGTQTEQNNNSAISIAKPSENDVVSASPVNLSGLSKPDSVVIVSGENKDYLATLDNKGSFTVDVDLVGGINQITAVAIDSKGAVAKQAITIIYSSEFAKIEAPTAAENTESPESSDSVRQKVIDKVDQAANSPTSYLGTVTDIAENTIQLKTPAGEIRQISSLAEPSVIKDGKTVKEMKLADIAIGDFIVAMGFRNGNHVLEARRIMITTQSEQPKKDYLSGKVASNTKGQITLSKIDSGESLKLVTNDNSIAYLKNDGQLSKVKFSSLTENDVFAAAGTIATDKFTADTLFVTSRP